MESIILFEVFFKHRFLAALAGSDALADGALDPVVIVFCHTLIKLLDSYISEVNLAVVRASCSRNQSSPQRVLLADVAFRRLVGVPG